MDYADALAADFGSDDSDEEIPNVTEKAVQTQASNGPSTLEELLATAKLGNIERRLRQIDPDTRFLVPELSIVSGSIDLIKHELSRYADKFNVEYMELVASVTSSSQSEEYQFLMKLSALPELITNEMDVLHKYVVSRYRVFPELETLIGNSVDYCKIVSTIGLELSNIRTHELFLKEMLSGEKVLAVEMAAIQQAPKAKAMSASDWDNLKSVCEACIALGNLYQEISEFVAEKLARYAPNVSALVGSVVASQLLISTGSLPQLALTPSCNLPSLGVRDLLSQQSVRTTHIRSTGYLYHCSIVNKLPPEIIKQALRILSGKVILAARIDVSRSSPDGALGARYRQEVEDKLDKLLLPPDQSGAKALPVPQERKSKKRAGRRFRKMKERFNMSDLRKAQNKMEFGKAERTITDTFGEEVGLGMSRELDAAKVNRNTDARLSKSMIQRLHRQKEKDLAENGVFSSKRAAPQDIGTSKKSRHS